MLSRGYFTAATMVLLAAGSVASFWWFAHKSPDPRPLPQTPATITLVDHATLNTLPQRDASSADTSHLANGLLPPVNMWLSGMVLQKLPQPVYPMPISFLAKENGFEVGLPPVSSTATDILGEHVPGIRATLESDRFVLTRYDKLSATLTYQQDNQPLGTLTVTEGSPFVFYSAQKPSTIRLNDVNPADIQASDSHYLRFASNGTTYAVYTQNGTIVTTASSVSISADRGAQVAFYALPGTNDPLKPYAGNSIESVIVNHTMSNGTSSTKFDYKTVNGKPTVFAAMPYQTMPGKSLTTYESIWGVQKVVPGTSFTTTVPTVTPQAKLDLSGLTASQKEQLIASLTADVDATTIDQQDSYFAGKQLARAANLLSIAEQLQQPDAVNRLKELLNHAFADRLNNRYFYYDSKLKGVTATTTAFGSQDFNDHHFHYGYWLYAGSILATYDKTFLIRYQKQLDLLAADIASYSSGSDFPVQRYYDPYTGHSWAAGLAPFADGNNQESSSEAVHAWNGVALWGQATHNRTLEDNGRWMLANEANAAQKAWRAVDTSQPGLASFTSPLTSLNFAGKRTYSTFFSPAAAAKLGIQLIPMDPAMRIFSTDKQHIPQLIRASIQDDNYNVPLGDYILMYEALIDPQKANQLANRQTVIDDGNSKTYLLAWIDSLLNAR